MKIPGIRFIVPVLICTLFAACSSSRSSAVDRFSERLRDTRYVCIDLYVYETIGVRNDTLHCRPVYNPDWLKDGVRIHITQYDELMSTTEYDRCLAITLREETRPAQRGDTLCVAIASMVDVRELTDNASEWDVLWITAAIISGMTLIILILKLATWDMHLTFRD